jgi:putative molybdopterin biosynthesis protein
MIKDSKAFGRTRSGRGGEYVAVVTTARLRKMREARGFGATEIARRVGVSRQTIYAIESGDYIPNTAVALQLARVLEVSVEDLFSIGNNSEKVRTNIQAELLAGSRGVYSAGELVRLGRVGSRTIAVPTPHFPTFLSDADGVIATRGKTHTTIRAVAESASQRPSLVLAGCDPALSVLAGELGESTETEVISVPCSSQEALNWLKKGLVHVAGTHLRDRATGEYNVPAVTALFGKGNVRIVTFAEWEQGLIVPRGNPKRIRSVADLGGKKITIVNREKGSGARGLLDSNLRDAGIRSSNLKGYDRIVPSHLAAALAVASSQVDCCVATVSAAKCLGLDFIALSRERFDLIIASSEMETAGIRALLDALNRASLRRKLAMLAGYEVKHTGEMLM